jgi:7-carboxy-7-deazaguanine synthase (Cx14CxxC type)
MIGVSVVALAPPANCERLGGRNFALESEYMYSVKEIFYTLQGEGMQAGRPSVFCRFSGCNLWNGLERDRNQAICKFCDTDFVGTDGTFGGKFSTAEALATQISELWPDGHGHRYVVLTGGEPLLQVDTPLISALHKHDFTIAVETNGTILAPKGIDWLCVSPKSRGTWVQKTGDELKLVFPQEDLNPAKIETQGFDNYFLQAMDGPDLQENIAGAIDFCQKNPMWKLSLQTHKIINIR